MDHLKKEEWTFKKRFLRLLSTPFIFGVAIPIIIADICIEIYHRISFPLYGLEYVKRSDYIRVFDRGALPYLNPLQKIFCIYCGYVNGVFAFWVEIGARTEKYWCGIHHKDVNQIKARPTHSTYSKYGDEKEFNDKYNTHCKLKNN